MCFFLALLVLGGNWYARTRNEDKRRVLSWCKTMQTINVGTGLKLLVI